MAADRTIALIVARNRQDEVLLLWRPETVHCGGLWSFPGGKVETGEGPLEAAMRELREETGLEGIRWRQLGVTTHVYPDRALRFLLFACACDADALIAGSEARWVQPDELPTLEMPEANRAMLPMIGECPEASDNPSSTD